MRSFDVLLAFVATLFISGCSTTVVHDTPSATSNIISHCQGDEHFDHSSVAVIPLPLVAFIAPHADLHELKPDDYLNRCGAPQQLANREVDLHWGGCIPASVTEIVTLGIWQWCPTRVSWSADVTNGATSRQSKAPSDLPRTYVAPSGSEENQSADSNANEQMR